MATENTNEPKLSHEQYDMLKRCMRKKDMSEWNQWRKDNPGVEIWLDGISPREGSFLGVPSFTTPT